MRRFTGEGEVPKSLDAILHEDFGELRAARRAEDERILRYANALTDADLAGWIRYRTIVNPADMEQQLSHALDHFFNHQTHHRGQAHALADRDHRQPRRPSISSSSSARPALADRAKSNKHLPFMLSIENLSVRIAGRLLIDHASVQIPAGARVGLVGRNGTGKTTLFHVISGDLGAETGDVTRPARDTHRAPGAGGPGRTRSADRGRAQGRCRARASA